MKNYDVLQKCIAAVQMSAILTEITFPDTWSYIYHGSENVGTESAAVTEVKIELEGEHFLNPIKKYIT